MAGIGEASAIIAVAQVGIKLSKTIFEFASEVRDAPKEIRRIGRDICTTSERLEEIGRLIEKNPISHLFSEGGIASAIRCSNDCDEIITEVTILLAKGGWVSGSAALDKKDLDISLLDALRWPFIRSKLASPQAELEKVKASLTLLFNSAMANASSNPMQSEYALQIPRLKKWAEQATRKAEDTKRRARSTANNSGRPIQREVRWEDEEVGEDEEDAEMRRKFVEYRVKLIQEEEERRAQEQAAKIQADKEEKQRKEEAIRREIEQDAIDHYKKQQEEIHASKSKKEKDFKEELARLGLEPEKIQSIIETPSFQTVDWIYAIEDRSHNQRKENSIGEQDATQNQNDASSMAASKTADCTRSTRPWLPRRFSKLQRPDSLPSHWNSGNSRHSEEDHDYHSTQCLELWLVDLVSGQKMELAPSHEWLKSKLEKTRYDEVSHKLAKLKHPWRATIQDFVHFRNEKDTSNLSWKLCFIGLPRRVPKIAVFGHRNGGCLVRLIVCQQRSASDLGNTAIDSSHSGRQPLDDSPSNHSVSKADKSILITSPKGALRHPNSIKSKNNDRHRQSEPREVSFADPLESDMQVDYVTRVKIETEVIDGETQRGTTLIPSVLVESSALEQLNIPWIPLYGGVDDDRRHFLKIPKALTPDEIEELQRITRSKIIDGEVSWRKLPVWEVEEHKTVYSRFKQPPDPGIEPKASTATTGSAQEGSRNDSKHEPIPAASSGVPNFESVPRQSRLGIAGNDGQPRMSREQSGTTEEIIIPRDRINRTVGSEYQRDFESSRDSRSFPVVEYPEREYHRFRPTAVNYYDWPEGTNDVSVRRSIPPPPLPRRRPTFYGDWATETPPRYIPRREEPFGEVLIRDSSRERTRPERVPSIRDEFYIREQEIGRPRYRDERNESVVRVNYRDRDRERERKRDISRHREDEEIIIRQDPPREGQSHTWYKDETIRQDRERVRSKHGEESDEGWVFSERGIMLPKDREERDTVFKRRRPRGRENDEIFIRRDYLPERPRYRDERDDKIIIRREESRERDRYDAEEIVIRDRERGRPRYKVDEKIVIRSDRSWDRPRYREEDTDEITKRRSYLENEVGPLVLRSNRGRRSPSLDPWDRVPALKAQGPMGQYNDRYADGSFRRLNTPAPSCRLASQRNINGNRVEMDSDGIRVRPLSEENRPMYTHAPGLTDEDIISSALERFTTFNVGTRDTTSPIVVDSPDLANGNPPSYATNLKQAQRKLDELLEKHQKAMTEGDFTAASDLQFYAIPDVRALVEELKAQEAKAKPREDFDEAESEDEKSSTHNLQRRITEVEDSDEEVGDAASKRHWSEGGVNSGATSIDGTIELVERRGQVTFEPEAQIRERCVSILDGNNKGNGGLKGVVRRPTNVTVEDDVGD